MIEVKLVQLPVGQGGFHSATIDVDGNRFWYVYDCGSSNPVSLQRELSKVDDEFDSTTLDLLVLSHLDEDHVNGVERLLRIRDVTAVALPYLTQLERVYVACRDAFRGRLTESRLDLIVDPTKWLRDRGAREIIHVLPSGETPSGEENEGERFGPIGELDGGALRLVGAHRVDGSVREEFPDIDAESSVLPAGKRLLVAGSQSSKPLWEIVPFWKSPANLRAFMADVMAKLQIKRGKRSTFLKRVVEAIKDKRKRRCLADLYEDHAKDRNRSSMCLYSGPSFPFGAARGSETHLVLGAEGGYRIVHSTAWLSTGDAPLRELAYGSAFEQFYKSRFPEISVFVLPHHGSGRNFPVAMMSQLRPTVWLAPSGRNSYRHPTPWLRRWASRHGTFWRVSHQERTEMFMDSRARP